MSPTIWLEIAQLCRGVQEIPGTRSNPLILQWARDIGAPLWYDNDDKAWCAVFWNRVNLVCGFPLAGSGYDLVRAKSALLWGVPLSTPSYGCTGVFTRSGGGHVGWLVGEQGDLFRVRGGNQGNTVSDTWIEKDRLSLGGLRWPEGIPLPTTPLPQIPGITGEISENER